MHIKVAHTNITCQIKLDSITNIAIAIYSGFPTKTRKGHKQSVILKTLMSRSITFCTFLPITVKQVLQVT